MLWLLLVMLFFLQRRRSTSSNDLVDDDDDDDDDDDGDDGNGRAAPVAKDVKKVKKEEPAAPKLPLEDGEEELSSLSDDASEVEGPPPSNQVLCQFANVKKGKCNWKAALQDGIVKINGRDYVFSAGVGILRRW